MGTSRIRRRALLAAVLPAAAVATALPAAAEAATVELVNSGGNGVVRYTGEPGEVNNVHISFTGSGIRINDLNVPVRSLDSECTTGDGDGFCPGNAGAILVFTGDRNDVVQYTAPHSGYVSGGDGADTIFGGMRQAGFGRQMEPVTYAGADSTFDVSRDTVSYLGSNAAVEVNLDDTSTARTFDDGRPGDLEGIDHDIDVIEGSNFDDRLVGSDRGETFRGLNGNDLIAALGGDDFIDEGSAPNGADQLGGGPGMGDRISYGTRTSGVNVSLDSVRNDGATGEQDNVGGSVEHIFGSNFRDVLSGNGQANTIDGFGGPDTIDGLAGDDTLSAGAANNSIVGGTGNDVIFARNGEIDNIDCGDNTDTADRDTSENRVIGCERGQVGVLRLTPATVRAKAGETVRLRLSWRHPRAWRQLRSIALRLTRDGMPVGEVTIDPHRKRIAADGAISLARRAVRLTAAGRIIAARVALRLDESLAGQTLRAEVEATDRRGRRQLERDAATVRVAS
ncbi:MAG TPA: calcium-binding protein [Solirubrobacteraceae bacterium]|nr:calcium-binding protein [Solirubrobacteraceae bacterium]